MDRIRLWWNIIPARQTAAGPVRSLFSFYLSLLPSFFTCSSLSRPLHHLSSHFPHLPLSCLSLSLPALFLPTPWYPPPFPCFLFSSTPTAAASEKSVWNLPPIRGLAVPPDPLNYSPWQLLCCLKCLIHRAEAHPTLPGNWSLFKTGRDKHASPSDSKCKVKTR